MAFIVHRLADQLTRTGLQQTDTSVDQQALAPALQVVELGVVQRQEQLPWASQVLPKIDYNLLSQVLKNKLRQLFKNRHVNKKNKPIFMIFAFCNFKV